MRFDTILKSWLLSPFRQIAMQSPAGQWSSPCISSSSRPVCCSRASFGRHDSVQRLDQALSVPLSSSVVSSYPEAVPTLSGHCCATPCRATDVSQNTYVCPLPLSGQTAAIGTKASFADIQNLAKTGGRELAAMLFPSHRNCFSTAGQRINLNLRALGSRRRRRRVAANCRGVSWAGAADPAV